MIDSFNARVKPATIGGFPTHSVYSIIIAVISGWIGLVLKGEIFLRGLMLATAVGSVIYAIYVLLNFSDWAFLKVKRASKYESESPLHRLNQ